jgi:magnesium-transporting ATPase (P-type)
MLHLGLFSNRWVLGGVGLMVLLQLVFTYLPAMHTAFGSRSIGWREWGLILGASLIVYIVIEVEKWIRKPKVTLNSEVL